LTLHSFPTRRSSDLNVGTGFPIRSTAKQRPRAVPRFQQNRNGSSAVAATHAARSRQGPNKALATYSLPGESLGAAFFGLANAHRSEEHTSELQSREN